MKKESIKEFIKSYKLTYLFYKVYKKIRLYQHNKNKEQGMIKFENDGLKVLFLTQDIFSEYGVNFFIANGTLLGIVRDKKLITRDMDLDIIVYLEKDIDIIRFRDFLTKKGYTLLHAFSVETIGITQETYVYDDIMVDISYVRKAGEKYYPYVLYDTDVEKNKVIVFPFTGYNTKKYGYQGHFINVPEKPDLFLEQSYGKNWKTPNPNYIYWENENGVKLDLKGSIQVFKQFKYR